MPLHELSWQEHLQQSLEPLHEQGKSPRTAVVGLGNELCGDDFAGIAISRALRSKSAGHENLLVIDAGTAPENFTGPLRVFAPHLVLLVDAAYLGCKPGTIRWLDWRETSGLSASTHTLPLHLLAGYLTAELGCQVALLGIQPVDTSFGTQCSNAVGEAAQEVIQGLSEVFAISE